MVGDRRVALLAMEPNMPDGHYTPFSYGVRRIQAALLADPELAGADVQVVESRTKDVDAWVAEAESIDADVIGMSMYMWSFPTFIEVARRLKKRRPDRAVVLGGPSARPAMFALTPFRDATAVVDALVTRAGEVTFRDVVRLRDRSRSALEALPGLHLPTAEGWMPTGDPPAVVLDELPSAIRMKLIPSGRTALLETYRGAADPRSFCRWEDAEGPGHVFSEAYLAEELLALKAAGAPSVQLADAALNLNEAAFRNLSAAEARVGLFKRAALFSSIYPAHVEDQHLELLRGAARAFVDVGLQSFSKDAPEWAQQPFREARIAEVVETLSRIAEVEVELVLGLPGDSPAGFRRTLDRARQLPCKVRIFHCLVLPDALMTRAPASFELRFDAHTLRMRSCLGWSEEALSRERSRLIEMAYREGGEITPDMWSFPGPEEIRRRAAPTSGIVPQDPAVVVGEATPSSAPAGADLQHVLEVGIREATSGGWTFVEASSRPGELVVIMRTREGTLVVEMRPASPTDSAYKVVDGVAFGYRSPRGARMSDGALRLLDRVLQRLHAPARAALGLAVREPSSDRVRRLPAS